jgi:hypothetical protein
MLDSCTRLCTAKDMIVVVNLHSTFNIINIEQLCISHFTGLLSYSKQDWPDTADIEQLSSLGISTIAVKIASKLPFTAYSSEVKPSITADKLVIIAA